MKPESTGVTTGDFSGGTASKHTTNRFFQFIKIYEIIIILFVLVGSSKYLLYVAGGSSRVVVVLLLLLTYYYYWWYGMVPAAGTTRYQVPGPSTNYQ